MRSASSFSLQFFSPFPLNPIKATIPQLFSLRSERASPTCLATTSVLLEVINSFLSAFINNLCSNSLLDYSSICLFNLDLLLDS